MSELKIEVGAEYNAMGEKVEISAMDGEMVEIEHLEREGPDGDEYVARRPIESVSATAESESWERTDEQQNSTDDVTHPEELARFACEQCGAIGDVEDGVDRKDEGGIHWSLCPDCGGEYEKVIVEKEGDEWALKKANYHEIDRFESRCKAKREGRDLAFRVEVAR